MAERAREHQERNVSETYRRHVIAPNLFYRWKDEAEQGAKAALGGEARPNQLVDIVDDIAGVKLKGNYNLGAFQV
jgi:transposase-like protein